MHRRGMNDVIIAVTGHRSPREASVLIPSVDQVLHRILDAFGADQLTLLSPLAEGSDRIVVQRALSLAQTRLIVPLPLPLEDYLVDFDSLESVSEFKYLLAQADEVIELEAQSSREDAYLAAGHYILNCGDVLIAVWDGNAAQGQAGTGDIVSLARDQELPLAWIRADNLASGVTGKKNPGGEHGKVTYERFPDNAHSESFEGAGHPPSDERGQS